MAVRKLGQKWGVRFHIQRVCANKGGAQAFEQRMRSLFALAKRDQNAGIEPCSIRLKLKAFLSDSRIGLGRRPCGYKTLERHRRRLEIFDSAFQHKRQLPRHGGALDQAAYCLRRLLRYVNSDLVSLRAFARWARKKGYAFLTPPLMLVDRLHTVDIACWEEQEAAEGVGNGPAGVHYPQGREREWDMGLLSMMYLVCNPST